MSSAILRSVLRAPIIVVLCAALALSAGCSALRFGYNQAADLSYWWLDGYVDFDDAQTVLARNAIASWFAWHRGTQLPDYADLLKRAAEEVRTDTTPARMCEWWDMLNRRFQSSLAQAVPPAAELMPSITPKQIQHIERRYAKANDEFREEFLQADGVKRRRASVERVVDRAELLYGRLDEAQADMVARAIARSPFDAELWFSEKKRRQQDSLHTLRRLAATGAGVDEAQAALRAYIERALRSPREEYRRYAASLIRYNCAFAAELHNLSTAAQRQSAAQRLEGWERDLRILAGNGSK